MAVDAGLDQTICEGNSATLTASASSNTSSGSDFSNFTPSLGDQLIETITLSYNSYNTPTSNSILNLNEVYYFKVTGSGSAGGGQFFDGGGYYTNGNPVGGSIPPSTSHWTWDTICDNCQYHSPVPSTFNSNGVYYFPFLGKGATTFVHFQDGGGYGDNSGSLTFEIYKASNYSTATYAWNTGETTASINVSSTTNTTYTVTATDGNCTATDDVDVTVTPAPIVNLGNDVAICQGDSTLLDAGSGHTNYLWNTGCTTQTIYADTMELTV